MGKDREKMHPKYVDHLLARTDADHDGIITLEEFLRVYDQLCNLDRVLCAPRRQPRKQEDLMSASRVKQRPGLRYSRALAGLACAAVRRHAPDRPGLRC